MSSNPKHPRQDVIPIAKAIVDAIEPHCTEFKVAGSLRRMCSEVGDIEIVCLPKTEQAPDGLFATKTIRSIAFCDAVRGLGLVMRGEPNGRYCKVRVTAAIDISLDIFMPQPFDFGRQLAIRTGSAKYSGNLARQWVKLGWCGTEDGLRLISECEKIGGDEDGQGGRWVCKWKRPTLPPDFLTEELFFAFLGIPMPRPVDRNL